MNLAYGCFAFLGLMALPVGLSGLLSEFGLRNPDQGSGGVGEVLIRLTVAFSTVFGFPLFVGMIVASVYGIKRTVRFRHAALVVLSTISIVCGGGFLTVMANEWDVYPGGRTLTYAMDIVGGLYVSANILIPAWWFTTRRWRARFNCQTGSWPHEPDRSQVVA
jgi:hypothetical protein